MEQHFRTKPAFAKAGRRSSCRPRSVYPDASDTELRSFIRGYLEDLKPQTEEEFAAVEIMVRAQWLTRTLWRLERDLFETKISELRLVHPDAEDRTLLALAFCSLAEKGGELDFISRAEDYYSRQYESAFKRLMRLRRKK